MKKEENFLEDFKRALVSTVKSISQKSDCEVSFGSIGKNLSKNVNLPEIKKLEKFEDIINFRALADSEALRLRYSNEKIFEADF